MTKIPVPFTGTKIDISEPTDAAVTTATLIGGFAALFFAQDVGASVKQSFSSMVGMGSEGQAPEVL